MPLPNVVVHHTVMGDGNCSTIPECILVMKEIQDFHMDGNGWADIGYGYKMSYIFCLYFLNYNQFVI